MATRKRSAGVPKPVPARRSPTPRGVRASLASEPPAPRRPAAEAEAPRAIDGASYLRAIIRDIPDFPKPGILFRDITTLLADARGLQIAIDELARPFIGGGLDAIVGVESRGFIFGAALAVRLGLPFVPVRKAGKLPGKTDRVAYSLEYGEAELEIHRDALRKGQRVAVVDDLLATGGTAAAAEKLVKKRGARVVAHLFPIELAFLGGREKLLPTPVFSLVRYDD